MFEAALEDEETRTVMVGLKADQGDDAAEDGDYTATPSLPVSITLTGNGTDCYPHGEVLTLL